MNSVDSLSIGALKVSIIPTITKVIVNGPATVILWSDGTKTVAKCSPQEPFDFEKGVAIAIAKRFISGDELKKAFRSARESVIKNQTGTTFEEFLGTILNAFQRALGIEKEKSK